MGVTLDRYVLMTDNYLVDKVTVTGGRKMKIDLFMHGYGTAFVPDDKAGGEAFSLPEYNGYQHITGENVFRNPASAWTCQNGKLTLPIRMHVLPEENMIYGQSIGFSPHTKRPVLIRRVQAKSAEFVTVYDIGSTPTVQGLEVNDGTIRVKTADASHGITLDASAATFR
jgi:hypothetical protein